MQIKKSIALKFSLWICIPLVVILLAASALLLDDIYKRLGSYLDEKALSVASETANHMDKIFLQTQGLAHLIADGLETTPRRIDEMQTYTKNRLTSVHQYCEEIMGVCVAYMPGMQGGDPNYNAYIHLLEGENFFFTEWHSESIDYQRYQNWFLLPTIKNTNCWIDPFAAFDGKLICSYSVPFYQKIDGKRDLGGVFVLDYEVNSFVNYLKELKLPIGDQKCTTCLMNPFGLILVSTETDYIMSETLFSLCETENGIDPEDFEAARTIFGRNNETDMPSGSGKQTFKHTRILNGKPCDMYYQTCMNNWVVAVMVPADWRETTLLPIFIRVTLLVLGLILLLACVIFIVSHHINKPLVKLAKAAEAVGSGNFDAALPEYNSEDEISQVTKSFGKMQTALKDYINKLEKSITMRERTEGELNTAKSIQKDLLPHILPPFDHYDNIIGTADLIPAHGVGGDLYDAFPVDKDHLAIIIGDVSGKGVPAALFMAVTQTLQRNIGIGQTSPSAMVSQLNQILASNHETNLFVTYWAGILNVHTGELHYTCAGHNPPLIRHADGTVTALRERHGPPIGILPNKKYAEEKIQLQSGDMIICYTDGVTEATNADMKMLSEERLIQTISDPKIDNPQLMLVTIRDTVFEFTGDAEQFDDVTIMITQFVKNSGQK
ncbi:MAG: SpoIIE family protein phosphatase [Verrucomicrobia bacterium]|nr:SpoIIE family protein phosphatase [Verrucomicrobiota bacterium]